MGLVARDFVAPIKENLETQKVLIISDTVARKTNVFVGEVIEVTKHEAQILKNNGKAIDFVEDAQSIPAPEVSLIEPAEIPEEIKESKKSKKEKSK